MTLGHCFPILQTHYSEKIPGVPPQGSVVIHKTGMGGGGGVGATHPILKKVFIYLFVLFFLFSFLLFSSVYPYLIILCLPIHSKKPLLQTW